MKAIFNPNYAMYHKGETVFCDSLQVAETFGRHHYHILRRISELNESTSGLSETFQKENFIRTYYKDSKGRKQPKYLLTKDGFVLLTMEFKTAKARQFKEAYINRFNDMSRFVAVLCEVKEDFPEFTEAVKLSHREPKPYHYSNEINMLYSVILGQSLNSYKKQNGIQENIREHLTEEQLLLFRKLQRYDIGLLLTVPELWKRKQILERTKEQ